ncbi:MAG: pilM [Candidatus Nomurabacteria bacterium]|nr:pilM [Candidatus Nomurabacteria bacterium]
MTTRFLRLAHSPTTGMEISDTVLRFITLKQHDDSVLPEHYAEFAIPEGCLDNGRIINKKNFVAFLKTVTKHHDIDRLHLVLASSQVQTMNLSVKGAAPMYIREALEKTFVLPSKDILYDYRAVGGDTETTTFQVTALPKIVSEEFLDCFKSVGSTILSIESVGHALSRALLPTVFHRTAMIVSIDTDVTTVTMVVNGKVSHTTMLEFGNKAFIDTIQKTLSIGEEEAQKIARDQGLIMEKDRTVFDAVVDDCVALVRHINDIYIAWRTAHKTLPALEMVYLTGPGSIMKGLDEYLAVGLRAPVVCGNVWANCLSFDEHIPSLSQTESVRYGAAIGAALTSGDTINLVPLNHKKSLHRKHVVSVTTKIVLSFVLGVAVGFVVGKILTIPGIHAQALTLLHKIGARW